MHRGTPGPGAADGPRRSRRRRNFYASRLLPEQAGTYEEALQVEGLGQEIAFLRAVIADHADDPEVVCRVVGVLVRAIAMEHRLSAQHEQSLYENILATLRGFAEAIDGEGAGG